MKHLFILLWLIVSGLASGQDNSTSDFLTDIQRYDISHLWTLDKISYIVGTDTSFIVRQEPLGYIGKDYQRFYIHFISAVQNSMNKLEYYIKGKTRVRNNIVSFQGIMAITEAKIYAGEGASNFHQGFVKGEYEFFGNPDKEESGIFRGVFKTDFYIDGKGNIQYNALNFYSDGFKNNQFEGIWTNNSEGNSIKCNWGDYRIPDSKDLDKGTDEFSVSDQYIQNGWLTYMIANGMGTDTDGNFEKLENVKWWISK